MYDRLLKANKKQYEDIVEDAILYALLFLSEDEKKQYLDNPIKPKEFVEQQLKAYNPVTDYLYYKEAERKRLRLAEAMLTAKEYKQRKSFRDIIEKNTNLWYTQSRQYAEDMAHNTVIAVWTKAGIKEVAWITEEDERVCSVCNYLGFTKNGAIRTYKIDSIPPKPHYRCRCKLVPVRDGQISKIEI